MKSYTNIHVYIKQIKKNWRAKKLYTEIGYITIIS